MIKKIFKREIKRLSFDYKHCAFTDLVLFKNRLFCCYREATDHVSGDGVIRVLCLSLNGSIIHKQRIKIVNADLRDPKFSIANKDELKLLAFARHIKEENQTKFTENLCWTSHNGDSWSSSTSLGLNFWWLWRVRYDHNALRPMAYGFAYKRSASRVDFYAGDPSRYMQCIKRGALSFEKHKLGYPNESDLVIEADGRINALVRRDADSFSAQFGTALPPYTNWRWRDLKEYIGGPVLHRLNSDYYLVAGRAWTGKKLVTRIWLLDTQTGKLTEWDTLPSAGDNSYPGIAQVDGVLYVSYYSSHIDQRSQIYLASYQLKNLLDDLC